jgi:hypothetical protein
LYHEDAKAILRGKGAFLRKNIVRGNVVDMQRMMVMGEDRKMPETSGVRT